MSGGLFAYTSAPLTANVINRQGHLPCLFQDMMENIIIKKQYMNRTDISEFVVPSGVQKIEDYAFAQCVNLKRVALPDTVLHVAANAFVQCDSLEKVYVYSPLSSDSFTFDMPFHKSEKLARILAVALKELSAPELFNVRSAGSPAWFAAWDSAFPAYLMSPDDKGFMPFLAGGEEDYEPEQRSREKYMVRTRIKKAAYIIDRLLAEAICPVQDRAKEAYILTLKKLCEEGEREALIALSQRKEYIKETVELFVKGGFLTDDTVQNLLVTLPDESVELKSLIVNLCEKDVFETLKL